MKLRWLAWLIIGGIWSTGILLLAAEGIVPSEVIAGLAGVIFTAIFGEIRYEALDKSWEEWFLKEREKWGK